MKSAKTPGPTQEDLDAKAAQTSLLQSQQKALDDQKAADAAEKERQAGLLAGNRVGTRSLLSNDWSGFARGGDLGPKA